MLPLRPIFPGAIYSVLFYGSGVLLLLLARDGLRWRSRRRRLAKGLCIKCKHELASASRCPECGTDVESAGEGGADVKVSASRKAM